MLADLVGIVNAECRALVEAGADFIQIDEPHSGMYAGQRAPLRPRGQPRGGGRAGQDRGARLLRQSLRAAVPAGAQLPQRVRRDPRAHARRRSSSSTPTGAWTTSRGGSELAHRQGAGRGRHRREGLQAPRPPPRSPSASARSSATSRPTSSGSIPTAASGKRRAGPPASSSPPSSRAPASSARSSEGVSRRGGGSGGPPRCPWPRWRGGRSRRRRPARPRGRS